MTMKSVSSFFSILSKKELAANSTICSKVCLASVFSDVLDSSRFAAFSEDIHTENGDRSQWCPFSLEFTMFSLIRSFHRVWRCSCTTLLPYIHCLDAHLTSSDILHPPNRQY